MVKQMDQRLKIILAFGLLFVIAGIFIPALANTGSNFMNMMNGSDMMNHMNDDSMYDGHMPMMHNDHSGMMGMMHDGECNETNMQQYHDICQEYQYNHIYEECIEEYQEYLNSTAQ